VVVEQDIPSGITIPTTEVAALAEPATLAAQTAVVMQGGVSAITVLLVPAAVRHLETDTMVKQAETAKPEYV
jgi:hypothetical protein